MGYDYELSMTATGSNVILKIICYRYDDDVILCKREFEIEYKYPGHYVWFDYNLNRHHYGGVYEGINKIREILKVVYPGQYDENEINIFEQKVREMIKSEYDTECDGLCECNNCI